MNLTSLFPVGLTGQQGAAGTSGTSGNVPSWTVKTSNYAAANGDRVIADTSSGAFAVTLPASPAAGYYIEINDGEGTWPTNNLTIARNGSKIDSLSEDLVCDISAVISLTYIDATIGWKVDFIAELGGNSGTVTSVSVTTANGVSGTVTNPNTTAAISLSLGAITPSSVSTGALTATGIATINGASVTTANAIAALAIDTSKALNTKSIAVDSTFTFSSTPSADQWFSLLVTNTDAASHILTIPSSYSVATNTTITTVTIPSAGRLQLNWYYTGSVYLIYGDPTPSNITIGTNSVALGATMLALTGITTLSASGSVSFTNTTDTTTSTGGAVVVSGGIGVAKNIVSSGAILSNSGTLGIGYSTGAGGAVTQLTSKSTGVTLNKACGAITMNSAELAAGAGVTFTVTNSAMAAGDLVVLNLKSGYTNIYDYDLIAGGNAAGSFQISVVNRSAGALSQAIVIAFAIIKGVIA
jgi:hypothetical protein